MLCIRWSFFCKTEDIINLIAPTPAVILLVILEIMAKLYLSDSAKVSCMMQNEMQA